MISLARLAVFTAWWVGGDVLLFGASSVWVAVRGSLLLRRARRVVVRYPGLLLAVDGEPWSFADEAGAR